MCLLTETRALSAQGEKRALVGNLTMPFETLFETLWVSNPIRPRSAASRNRVMRGPGVTQGAKRSQGARRPRN